jgi:hypothetical protein
MIIVQLLIQCLFNFDYMAVIIFFGLNTIQPPEVVGHFQFNYQSLKNYNVPPQSFKKFQFKHSIWFDCQAERNFDHFKMTSFCHFGDTQ